MSENKGADQGTHYHYHYYGLGPAPAGAPGGQGEMAMGGTAQAAGPQAGFAPGWGAAGGPGYGRGQGQGQGGYGPQSGYGQAAYGPAGYGQASYGTAAYGSAAPDGSAMAGGPAGGGWAGAAASGFDGANAHRHPGADSLVKGLIVGAGAAYLLTNEKAQRTIMRTAVQVWALLQGGIEELKERLHDAEAEVAGEAAATATEASPQPSAS